MAMQRCRGPPWISLRVVMRLVHAMALANCFLLPSDAFNTVRVVTPFTTTAWSRARATTPPFQRARLSVRRRPSYDGVITSSLPLSHASWSGRRRRAASGLSATRSKSDSRRGDGRLRLLPAPSSLDQEGGGGGGGGGREVEEDDAAADDATRNSNKKTTGEKAEKSFLGKAGDAFKAVFNAAMAAGTVASLALAAEAVWQLHGTPLTLSNAVPTLTKLLPLTGIGVFGAAQLVGLVARVVRVVVTLPIMVSGTWVILQNAPQLLPKGSNLTGAGSLAALLATPEVLEATAVVALLGGTAIWALNFATSAAGALLDRRKESSEDDELG